MDVKKELLANYPEIAEMCDEMHIKRLLELSQEALKAKCEQYRSWYQLGGKLVWSQEQTEGLELE